MEFWGVEVKAGVPVVVSFDDDQILHLSQATLGESKKVNEPVIINLKFGDQKLVLGSLSSEKFPQLMFDLVFEKEFELSHTSKSGSIYFMGYKTYVNDDEDESDYSDFSDPEEAMAMETLVNGKFEDPKAAKPDSSTKPNGKLIKKIKNSEPSEDGDEDSEDDDDDSEEVDSEDADSDEEMAGAESDESDEEESGEDDSDDSEDDEETPKKAEVGKKRLNDSATKTPVSVKKAKLATPQKTDGKKAGHAGTPYPKQAGKSPASKSGGDVSCKSCPKAFKTEAARQSHSAAKHK